MGKKLTWAPFIQSEQGVGKTFLIRLLRAMLGGENVGVVRPSDLINRFNAWALGSAVMVLDEIKIPRASRDMVDSFVNKLISDDDVTIEKKGQDVYSTRNTTNYLALTNHRNALHFRGRERRWWVVFSPVKGVKEEIESTFGLAHDTYFEKLHECLHYPGNIRKHFLEHVISDQFRRTIRAPITDDYQQIVFEEKRLLPGYEEAEVMIQEQDPCWNSTYILTKPFFNELMMRMDAPHELKAPFAKTRLLLELGYETDTTRIYLDKIAHRYYYKGRVDRAGIERKYRELKWIKKEGTRSGKETV